MGQVLGVSLSATLTQTLLARNLRARISDEDVRFFVSFSVRALNDTVQNKDRRQDPRLDGLHPHPARRPPAPRHDELGACAPDGILLSYCAFFLIIHLRLGVWIECYSQGIAVAIFLSVLPMEEFSLPDTVAAEPVKQTQTAPLERDAERAAATDE
jgi:hypothetical protein